MRTITLTLFAICLALPVYAETHGPLRSATTGNVVGMIVVAEEGDETSVRASVSTIKKRRAHTAWIFCRGDEGRIGPPDRLDGNIGSRTLEGTVDVGTFCPTGNAVEIVVIDHGRPVNGQLDGEEGSVVQVTTNNLTDPFCNGQAQPQRVCKVLATGIAPLP